MSSANEAASVGVGDAAAPHEIPIVNPPHAFERFRYRSKYGFHYTEPSFNRQWAARAAKRDKYQQREAFPRPDGVDQDEWKKAFNSADSQVYKEQGGSSVASGGIRRETYQTREIAEERLYNKYLAAGKQIPGPGPLLPNPRPGTLTSGNNSNQNPAQQPSASSSRTNKPKKTSSTQQPSTSSSSRRKKNSTHTFQAPSGSNLHQPNPFSAPKRNRKKANKKSSSSADKSQVDNQPFEFTAGENDPAPEPLPWRPFVQRDAPEGSFRPNQHDHDTVFPNLYRQIRASASDQYKDPKKYSKFAQPPQSPPTQESQASGFICTNPNPYPPNPYLTSPYPSDRVLVSAYDQLAFDPREYQRIAAEESSTSSKKHANEQASSENDPRKRQKQASTKVNNSCNADEQDLPFQNDPENDPDPDHNSGPPRGYWDNNFDNSYYGKLLRKGKSKSSAQQSSSAPRTSYTDSYRQLLYLSDPHIPALQKDLAESYFKNPVSPSYCSYQNYYDNSYEQPSSASDPQIVALAESYITNPAPPSSSSNQNNYNNSYGQSSSAVDPEIEDLAEFYFKTPAPRSSAKTHSKLAHPSSDYSAEYQPPQASQAPQGSTFDLPNPFTPEENFNTSEKPFDYCEADPPLPQSQVSAEIAARSSSSLDGSSLVAKKSSSSGKSSVGVKQSSDNSSRGTKQSSGNSSLGVKQSSGNSSLGVRQSLGNLSLGVKQSSGNSKPSTNQPSSSNSKLGDNQSSSNKSSLGTQKPHPSNITKAKMSSQAKKQKNKADYCSCKQVRHGTKMIACEGGCENWYHVSCVKLLCKDTDGVAKFICDDCVGHAGPTTYKRVCRLKGCSRPHSTTEGVDEGGNAVTIHSKYCSVEHRDKYWADAVARVDKDLLPELRSFMAQTAPGDFKTAGDQPTRAGLGVGDGGSAAGGGIVATGPPHNEEGMFSFDIKLRDSCHKNIAGFSATIVHYQNRAKLVDMVEKYSAETTKQYAEENGIEESAPKRAKGKAGKVVAHTICGYDPRLQASDRRIDGCLATPEGDEAWKSGVLGERPDFYVDVDPEFYKGICVRTNCPRHAGWLKIHQQECTVNLALNADWMEKEKLKLAEMYERVRVRLAIEREREQYAQERAAEMPEENRAEFLRLWKITKGDKNIILRKLLARFQPQGTAA